MNWPKHSEKFAGSKLSRTDRLALMMAVFYKYQNHSLSCFYANMANPSNIWQQLHGVQQHEWKIIHYQRFALSVQTTKYPANMIILILFLSFYLSDKSEVWSTKSCLWKLWTLWQWDVLQAGCTFYRLAWPKLLATRLFYLDNTYHTGYRHWTAGGKRSNASTSGVHYWIEKGQ